MIEKQPASPKVPDEVMSVIHDAAIEENRLRLMGVRPERIKEKVGKELAKKVINLGLSGSDTSQAFPPEERLDTGKQPQTLTDDEWDRVERLVDNGVMTYDEAIYRVRNR